MYRFVRFCLKGQPDTGEKHWWLEVSNLETLQEHTDRFFKPVMQEGFDDVSSKAVSAIFKHGDISLMRHPASYAGSAIVTINGIHYENTPLALFETANNMMLEAISNRVRDLKKGPIYLEDGVRQFGYNPKYDYYEIVETVESEKLEYPDTIKPTLSDVRYIQWPGGQHWYAKIGREDIVDAKTNQKWSTKEEAERAAKWYLETYY